MYKKPEYRSWQEVGPVNRFIRILFYFGGAAFTGFWLISVWLEGVARDQLHVATGVFHYPYAYKGCVGYLTQNQAKVAQLGSILAFGWGVMAISGLWLLFDERRAASRHDGDLTDRQKLVPVSIRVRENLKSLGRALPTVFPATTILVSPLRITECLANLQYALQLQGRSIDGRIKHHRIFVRKIITYRNSFQTRLVATLSETLDSTIIRCHFSMAPFVQVFSFIWFCGVCAMGLISISALMGLIKVHEPSPSSAMNMVAICLTMLIFGLALFAFGRRLAGDEQDFLLGFIRNATNANDTSNSN